MICNARSSIYKTIIDLIGIYKEKKQYDLLFSETFFIAFYALNLLSKVCPLLLATFISVITAALAKSSPSSQKTPHETHSTSSWEKSEQEFEEPVDSYDSLIYNDGMQSIKGSIKIEIDEHDGLHSN